MKRLRLCFPKAIRRRTLRRDSRFHYLYGYQITLTHVEMGTKTWWHLTPLSPLHEQLLRYLHLPTSLYTALAYNTS